MNLERYPQIAQALRESEAGQSLMQTYRWSQFRDKESNGKWKELFGATGQVLTHSELFYHLMEWMVRREGDRFTPEKAETLLIGVAVHDIGEAKINGKGIGDISAFAKTKIHEKKEVAIAYKALETLQISESLRDELADGYKKVVEGEDPELHFAFKALEKSEYVITAMKVYQNSMRLRSTGRRGLKYLEPMVGRVLIFDLSKALDVYVPHFPGSLGYLFKKSAPLIDEMYSYSKPWLLKNSEWKGKIYDHAAICRDFEQKWNSFKSHY
jgi:hypothetical protein